MLFNLNFLFVCRGAFLSSCIAKKEIIALTNRQYESKRKPSEQKRKHTHQATLLLINRRFFTVSTRVLVSYRSQSFPNDRATTIRHYHYCSSSNTMADNNVIATKVNEYLSFDEAVAYGPTHALWKALDEDQPLEVLIGIVEDKDRGFGGTKGKSTGTKYTPLHCAAQRNNIELAKYCLANGTDVNAKTYEDYTALDFAEHTMRYPEMVALLREHGGE